MKLREAEARREFDLQDADLLIRDARRANRGGDAPAAARLAKKALALYPEHPGALELLGVMYMDAKQFADAAHYFGILLKAIKDSPLRPSPLYNYGFANFKLRRNEEARKAFQEFLEGTKTGEPKFDKARLYAEHCLLSMSEAAAPVAEPVRTVEVIPPKRAAPVEAPPKVELPGVSIDFLPIERPAFASTAPLADHFLRRRLLELRLAQNFEDLLCLGSLNGVDSYVYQHETVRRVLRQFKGRALLADEVGLGKTIEACLILKEYWLRGMVRRALVLAPPSLAPQCRGELIEKFGFAAASTDDAEFRRDAPRFWKEEPLVVASIALARLEPHASSLAAAHWDMVIIDEAHCLKNRSSANWRLVNSLQKKFILMLTATPVENNLVDLYSLITVLKPGLLSTEGEFKKSYVNAARPRAPKNPEQLRLLLSEVMVRNTRATVDVRLPHRVAASVVAQPSPEEAKLYERVSTFVATRYLAVDSDKRSGIALAWLQRQAGSSPQALRRAVGRALSGESWMGPEERKELESIEEIAAGVTQSAKGLQFEKMLAGRSGKMVVFTEFLPTLDYLSQICERNGVSYALFSGDLSHPQKDAAIARFRDEADVLLSTGSGGEGRNLQFANTVVNFDLPWNPMRIEQRVGRVHRIGQTQEVFVFNFCQAGSIEEQLLRVLHDKINMFELVVGEIDAILGELEEGQDFAALVLDLWTAGRQAGHVDRAFDELAERLAGAKKKYSQTKELDESLFQSDFEA